MQGVQEWTAEGLVERESRCARFLLVDLSWVLHRSFHALGALTVKTGGYERPSGHVYGVLRAVQAWKTRYPRSPVVLCLDSGHGGRDGQDGLYKANREKSEYNIYQDVPDVLRLACLIPGVYFADSAGYEADDVLYSLARSIERLTAQEPAPRCGVQVYLHTADKDLHQAVSSRIQILKRFVAARTEELDPVGVAEVTAQWGVPPSRLVLLRAVLGDKSDNLPAVPRINRAALKAFILSLRRPGELFSAPFPEGLTKAQQNSLAKLVDYREQVFSNYKRMVLTDCPVTVARVKLTREERTSLLRRWKLTSMLAFLRRFQGVV